MMEAESTEIKKEHEQDRYNQTIDYHNRILEATRRLYLQMEAAEDTDPEKLKDAEQKYLEAQANKTKFLRNELENRKKDETEALEAVKKVEFDITKEKIQNSKTLDNIYDKYGDARLKAEREYAKKIKDIEKKRVENVKKINDGIFDIENETRQKIAGLSSDKSD